MLGDTVSNPRFLSGSTSHSYMDLNHVRELIDDKNFKDALNLLDNLMAEEPSDHILFEKASILFQTEDFEGADKLINEITRFGSPLKYWILKADICKHFSRLQDAYDCYDLIINTQPKPKYFFEQGNIKSELGEFQDALTCYKRALELDPENLQSLKAKCTVLKKLSRDAEYNDLKNVIRFLEMDTSSKNESASHELKKINGWLKKSPHDLKLHTEKIFLLIDLGRLQYAADCISKLENDDPPITEFTGLGKTLLKKLQHLKDELADISDKLESKPSDVSLAAQKIHLLANLEMYDDLRKFLEHVLKNIHESEQFLHKMMESLLSEKKIGAHLVLLEHLIEMGYKSAKMTRQQIYALNELGRFDEAMVHIQKILEKRPKDEVVLRMKLHTLSQMEPGEEYLKVIDQIHEINPWDEKILYRKVSTLSRLGEFAKAIAVADTLLEKDPDNMSLLTTKTTALSMLGKHTEVLELADSILNLRPGDTNMLKSKIRSLNSLGRHTEALELADSILNSRPEDTNTLKSKTYSLRMLGRHTEAIELADSILNSNPGDYGMQASKIRSLNSLGKHTEAIELADSILKLRPGDANTLKSKTRSLSNLGRHAEALEIVEGLLEEQPDSTEFIFNKAYILEKLSRYLESADLLESAFEMHPEHARRHAQLFARILHQVHASKDNHVFIDSKISNNTNNMAWIILKCKLYLLEHKYDEVKNMLEGDLHLFENPEFQKDLALCYESTYEIDKAISVYTAMLKTNPNDEFSLFGRCQTYIKKRMYDEAMSDIQKAYGLNRSSRNRHTIAFILGITGRYDEALDILKDGEADGQDSRDDLKLKAVIHRKNKDFESSMQCYRTMLEDDPNDISGLLGVALVYEATEQYDLALEQIDGMLENHGFLEDAIQTKAVILVKIGNYEEARKCLDVIIEELSHPQEDSRDIQPE